MKLRYYLRGLGIGILVTALIMGMTSKAGRPLTDAEIRAKALTLGMVDLNDISLGNLSGASDGAGHSDIQDTEPNNGEEDDGRDRDTPETVESSEPADSSVTPSAQGTQEPEGTEEPKLSSPPLASTPPESSPTHAPSSTPIPTPMFSPSPTLDPTPAVDTVTILIVRGDSSYTVSRRLEEAGLIENARDYDTYLVDNGYSKTIRTGTYRIPVNATWEEIAKIIA